MFGSYSEAYLREMDIDPKDTALLESTKQLCKLKIMKLSNTKFQVKTNSYLATRTKSLNILLNNSKSLIRYREMLFLTLRQVYLKCNSLLTVLQWMSPPFDFNSQRAADHQLLKQLFTHFKPQEIKSPIFIIEIERLLKVLQFDHKEISLKILFQLCTAMGCLFKGDKEYVFYDEFFLTLVRHFRPIQNENPGYSRELDKKIKFENTIKQQRGLRKIGVVNEYQEQNNIDSQYYDSIANLLQTKGHDFMQYSFVGFSVSDNGDNFVINAIYANPFTQTKLFLRDIEFNKNPMIKKKSRPQSGLKYAKDINLNSNPSPKYSSSLKNLPRNFKLFHFIKYLPLYLLEPQPQLMVMVDEDETIKIDKANTTMIQEDEEMDESQLLHLRGNFVELAWDLTYQDADYMKVTNCKTFFGISKMSIQLEVGSDSEMEDEEFNCDDGPIYVELSTNKEPEKVIKKPKSFKTYTRPTSSKKQQNHMHRPSQVIERQQVPQQERNQTFTDEEALFYSQEVNRQIQYQFAEYETKVGIDEVLEEKDQVSLNLREFGSQERMTLEVFNHGFIRAIKIAFPDSNRQLPTINFPFPNDKDTFDKHIWTFGPIENIKGLQIYKKSLHGRLFVNNFVLLVQDDDYSRINCQYHFEQNQMVEELPLLLFPQADNDWRLGYFKIYLNFDLRPNKTEQEFQTVMLHLKKLNQIFDQMFPGLTIEENAQKIKPKTVFEVYLQSMGRPNLRDHYDRYYLVSVPTWKFFVEHFERNVTELIDNITLLILSYGGKSQFSQSDQKNSMSSSNVKAYPYKFVQA